MSECFTPIRTRSKTNQEAVSIPPSPFLKQLGYGTGIAVYKLERSPLANKIRSPWAIKKLIRSKLLNTDTYHDRLKEEAKVLCKLNHPNIIGFRAFITTKDKQNCLAMEECTNCLGNMLEDRNEQGLQACPANAIMKVALDISEALNYLHTQALILHGDLKSYNILINGNFDTCKLCDFGVSLPLTKDGELDRAKAGEDATYIGSRLWCAPEVFDYPQAITSKADIFSYGLVLWEMLALTPPRIDILDDSCCMDDSLDDDSMGTSVLDDKMNSSGFEKRPELPPQEFDDSYRYVLEIYHCSTEKEPKMRPSALDLTISIPEMIKELDKKADKN